MLSETDTASYIAQIILEYHLKKTVSLDVILREINWAIELGNKRIVVITSVNGEKIVELLSVQICKERLGESRPFSQPLRDFFDFVDSSHSAYYFLLFIELDNGFNCQYIILSQSTKISSSNYVIKEGK